MIELSLTSPLMALLVALLALWCAGRFVRVGDTVLGHRYAALDGLRGLLAIGVFLHHVVFWYPYAQGGAWAASASRLYMGFGRASVMMFFMITAFLFFSRLLDGRKKPVDWMQLYVSRFMRLAPLYACVVLLIFLIVAVLSRFQILVTTEQLQVQFLRWLFFTIGEAPAINGLPNTHLITAGVIWSLPYEWYFYFMLPVLGLLVGTRSRAPAVLVQVLSLLCLLSFASWGLKSYFMQAFLGGIVAAVVVRFEALRALFAGRGASLLALLSLFAGFAVFNDAHALPPMLFLTVAFTYIVCGADLFGLLVSRPACALGHLSYGVYLLHGIVLFLVLRLGLGVGVMKQFSVLQYWLLILTCVPLLIGVSALSWHYIEAPAIRAVPRVQAWLRQVLNLGVETETVVSTAAERRRMRLRSPARAPRALWRRS